MQARTCDPGQQFLLQGLYTIDLVQFACDHHDGYIDGDDVTRDVFKHSGMSPRGLGLRRAAQTVDDDLLAIGGREPVRGEHVVEHPADRFTRIVGRGHRCALLVRKDHRRRR